MSTAVDPTVEKTLHHWRDTHLHNCREMYLLNPQEAQMHGMKLTFAHKGVFKCGELYVGDMALFRDGALGKVRSFWQRGDQISIGIDRHRHMNALQWDLWLHMVSSSLMRNC